MKTYAFDIEVYPNFFSVIFIDIDDALLQLKDIPISDINEKLIELYYNNKLIVHTFIIYDNTNDLGKLLSFLKSTMYLVGFNNLHYDNVILNYLIIKATRLKSSSDIVNKLFDVSKEVIDTQNIYASERLRMLKRLRTRYSSIDLFQLGYNKIERKSLKQTAINLKWPRIQDLPYPPEHYVTPDEVAEIIDYNANDVLITLRLFIYLKKAISFRFDATNRYNIPLINKSKSGIADTIFTKFYMDATGISYDELKTLKTEYPSIKLSNCISPKIRFETKVLKDLHQKLFNTKVIHTKDDVKERILIGSTQYDVRTGGLHSVDNPAEFHATDDLYIIDADVTSYYPRIILNERIKPAHLQNVFLKITNQITEDRVKAKLVKDMTQADILKITINSVFGKMGYEFFWLYDRKAMLRVTINGQLFLLMLIEQLEKAGLKVISANTDGIVTLVPKSREEEYNQICANWEQYTNFNLEYTYYNHYIRRDVNNYITKTPEGKIKMKGDFITPDENGMLDITKGYDMPIVAIALENHFINNIPIEDTIYNHNEIYNFCKSQKIGSGFSNMFTYVDPSNRKIISESLQRNVRYFVSYSGGTLTKNHIDGRVTKICKGNNVTIFNNFYPVNDFKDYKVFYPYYLSKTREIINLINQNNQTKLF